MWNGGLAWNRTRIYSTNFIHRHIQINSRIYRGAVVFSLIFAYIYRNQSKKGQFCKCLSVQVITHENNKKKEKENSAIDKNQWKFDRKPLGSIGKKKKFISSTY